MSSPNRAKMRLAIAARRIPTTRQRSQDGKKDPRMLNVGERPHPVVCRREQRRRESQQSLNAIHALVSLHSHEFWAMDLGSSAGFEQGLRCGRRGWSPGEATACAPRCLRNGPAPRPFVRRRHRGDCGHHSRRLHAPLRTIVAKQSTGQRRPVVGAALSAFRSKLPTPGWQPGREARRLRLAPPFLSAAAWAILYSRRAPSKRVHLSSSCAFQTSPCA